MFVAPTQPEQLFKSPDFHIATTQLLADVYGLFPQERNLIQKSTMKRRSEFSAGRDCARKALRKLGKKTPAILPDQNGCPIWPPSIVGSISHTENYAIAVVAMESIVSAVGVDIECWRNSHTTWPSISKICSDEERQWVESKAFHDQHLAAHILFSVRESVYKCVYSLSGTKLAIDDLVIKIQEPENRFHTTFTKDEVAHLKGVFGFNDSYVFSAAWV